MHEKGEKPSLSCFQLRSWATNSTVARTEPEFSKAVLNMIAYFNSTREELEHLYAWWEVTMRFVRAKLVEIFPSFPTHAKVTDVYPSSTHRLTEKIQNLKFDITAPLCLTVFVSVEELQNLPPAKLTSAVWVPQSPNNPGFDALLFFEDQGEVYVLAIENKYTRDGNTSTINLDKDVCEKRKSTLKSLKKANYDEAHVIFVLMARRPCASMPQALPQNTIFISQPDFEALLGPTMMNIIEAGEMMVRRTGQTKAVPDQNVKRQCKGTTQGGVQCGRYQYGFDYCQSHRQQAEPKTKEQAEKKMEEDKEAEEMEEGVETMEGNYQG
jgi:hypothetical protein